MCLLLSGGSDRKATFQEADRPPSTRYRTCTHPHAHVMMRNSIAPSDYIFFSISKEHEWIREPKFTLIFWLSFVIWFWYCENPFSARCSDWLLDSDFFGFIVLTCATLCECSHNACYQPWAMRNSFSMTANQEINLGETPPSCVHIWNCIHKAGGSPFLNHLRRALFVQVFSIDFTIQYRRL